MSLVFQPWPVAGAVIFREMAQVSFVQSSLQTSLRHDEMIAALPDVYWRNKIFFHRSRQNGRLPTFGLEQV